MNVAFSHANRSWISREEYDRTLSGYVLPITVIATKPTSNPEGWKRADHRSVLHNCWSICTSDQDNLNIKPINIFFDSFIDVGGVRLSDDQALHDNLTKKIIIISALTTGIIASKVGAMLVYSLSTLIDWNIRWRRSISIDQNSLLEEIHFSDYLSRLKSPDILDLVPIFERLDRLVEEAVADRYRLPLSSWSNATPDWEALAQTLGVSPQALARSSQFRAELADRLPLLAPGKPVRLNTDGHLSKETNQARRSQRRIESHLTVWKSLYRLSARGILGHDPLRFDPFRERPFRLVAAEVGRRRTRTATIPPPDFLRLLDAAAKWVLDYAPHILHARDILTRTDAVTSEGKLLLKTQTRKRLSRELDARLPAGMPRLWLSWRADKDFAVDGRLCVGEAIKYLLAACAILVGGFGARRVGEVKSLKMGCIIEEKPGLCELSIYIEKTLRSPDRVPVPALLKVAVAALEKLTAGTRAVTGTDWLFEVLHDPERNPIAMVGTRWDLNGFAKINSLPVPEGWDCWALKAHQLRRAFAICYYHGFSAASLDALSRFLRHFDPEMTRIYINDVIAGAMGRLREEIDARTKCAREAMTAADREWFATAKRLLQDLEERSSVFNEVRCEAFVHRMLQMWEGKEAPIGRGAAKLYGDLNAMVTEVRAKIRIGARSNDPDAVRKPLIAMISNHALTHYLEPVPGNAAHCTCRPGHDEDLAEAECLKEKAAHRSPWSASAPSGRDIRPDYAFSNLYVCLRCAHCAAFSDNQKVIARDIARRENCAVRASTPPSKKSAADSFNSIMEALAAAKKAVPEGGRHA